MVLEPIAIDFKRISHGAVGAVMRVRLALHRCNLHKTHLVVEKAHIQIDRYVSHPHTNGSRIEKDKKHAVVGRQMCAMLKPFALIGGSLSDFNG